MPAYISRVVSAGVFILTTLCRGSEVLQGSCWQLEDFALPVQEFPGDILIGGLFPLHVNAEKKKFSFTSKPSQSTCHGFDYRAFRWLQTMVFAVMEINADNSLLPGVQLGYRIHDSCDYVETGLRAALSLVNDSSGQKNPDTLCLATGPVPVFIGLASSSPTRAVAHTLGPFGIPLISYFATCTCLSNKQTFPSFLRTVPSDFFQVQGLVSLANHFGWRWLGAIGTDDDYSQYGIQAFAEQLREVGGCLAFHITLPKEPSLEQLCRAVDFLDASSVRVIVAFSTESQLYGLFREVTHRNMTGKQWVASEAWVTATLLSTPQFHSSLTGTLGFAFRSANMPALGDFLIQARPSPKPESVFVNMFWEEMFACKLDFTNTILEPGVQRCNKTEDLRGSNTIYSDTTQLRVSYNVYKAVYATAHALHQLLQCNSSADPSNKTCKSVSQIQPQQLLSYLKKVNFTSTFGEKVLFDSNGEPVPLYDIVNWQSDGKGGIRFKTVGIFDASAPQALQLRMNEDLIMWTGGQTQVPVSVCSESCPSGTRQAVRPREPPCCFDCIPCADGEISNLTDSTECTKCPLYYWSDRERKLCVAMEEEFLSFQESLGIILLVLSVLGVTLTLTVLVVFYQFRCTPIVRANNSELSFLILLSLALCFLCALLFIGRPSDWSCRARQATFGVSFVLCISSLLAKTVVVLVAFRSTLPGSRAVRLFGPPQQRAVIFSCTAFQGVMCACWLAWSPPYPFKNTVSQPGKILLECEEGFTLYLVLGYIGLLSCACFILAFLGRKLPDTFNEAKMITFSMLIFLAVWISFIPAQQSSPGKYTVAVEMFAIIASSFGLLGCIFLPKCFIILFRPEKNVKKSMVTK